MRLAILKSLAVTILLTGCVTERAKNWREFSKDAVYYGLQSNQKDCESPGNGVWVEADGVQECIRYYASGLKSSNPIVLAHLHGDVAWAAYISGRVVGVASQYEDYSPQLLQKQSDTVSKKIRLPFIYLARPGVFGSSGFHGDRYREKNPRLINAALDAIKKKHKISQYSLTGQSGGGMVVSALLNWRSDIKCAVLASSPGSFWDHIEAQHPGANLDPYRAIIFDPSDMVDEMPEDEKRQIFVIADVKDDVVAHRAQKAYAEKLKKAGHRVSFKNAAAEDQDSHSHDLAGKAIGTASICSHGMPEKKLQSFLTKPTKKNKVEPIKGRTQSAFVEITWDGHLNDVMSGLRYNEKTLVFRLLLASYSTGNCSGTITNIKKETADWKMKCLDNLSASGNLFFDSDRDKLVGKGRDNFGKQISFSAPGTIWKTHQDR